MQYLTAKVKQEPAEENMTNNETASAQLMGNTQVSGHRYHGAAEGTEEEGGGQAPVVPLSFGSVQYSFEEREFLQRALSDKLDNEFISQRPGPGGGSVHYIETWRAIELANKTFGFNGWSSSIVEITQDYLDATQGGRFNCGVSAVVRISLKDGSFHEDVGYGTSDNQKHKGAALEQAKKKAVSDGLKRGLRNFGNALGLTVYDREHIKHLKRQGTKSHEVKAAPKVNPHFVNGSQSQTQQDSIKLTQQSAISTISTHTHSAMSPPSPYVPSTAVPVAAPSSGTTSQISSALASRAPSSFPSYAKSNPESGNQQAESATSVQTSPAQGISNQSQSQSNQLPSTSTRPAPPRPVPPRSAGPVNANGNRGPPPRPIPPRPNAQGMKRAFDSQQSHGVVESQSLYGTESENDFDNSTHLKRQRLQ